MNTCIIFCAAEFDRLIRPVGAKEHIIAADGGVRHARALGITPHEILGDFDSLGYVPRDASVFPVEKDDTDAMLAVRRGLEQGYRSFLIYGGMDGPRVDHTVANFQLLHFLAEQGAFGILVGRHSLAAVIRQGSLRFPGGKTGTLSVFCSGAQANGVDIEGLYYSLQGGSLSPAFPLGVSNHFTERAATVRVAEGALLVIWDRDCGLPEEVVQNGEEMMGCYADI